MTMGRALGSIWTALHPGQSHGRAEQREQVDSHQLMVVHGGPLFQALITLIPAVFSTDQRPKRGKESTS